MVKLGDAIFIMCGIGVLWWHSAVPFGWFWALFAVTFLVNFWEWRRENRRIRQVMQQLRGPHV